MAGEIRLRGRAAPVDAVVRVPGSKSVANRALLCAALAADGVSRIGNVPGGDDCAAMLDALRQAGCAGPDGSVTGGVFPGRAARFDAGIAGTTSRFLTAAAVLSADGIVIDGGGPLRARPMADLHDALRSLGAAVEPAGGPAGHLPVRVARGEVRGGRVSVRGDVSSQFVSALMLVAPRLPDGLVIEVTGDLVSRPYVEMTAAVMRDFGAAVDVGESVIRVSGTPYRATSYEVEPDYSSAAFPLLAPAFAHGRVTVPGLARASMQGDSYVLEIARMMGLRVSVDGADVTVSRAGDSVLRPVQVDLRDASDLVPAVAVACTVLPGTSRLSGIGFIRSKESDRIGDLAHELNAAGALVEEEPDGLVIHGGRVPFRNDPYGTHHDHRLAMAFALTAAGGAECLISDPGVVAKSWPGYFSDMAGLLGPAEMLN